MTNTEALKAQCKLICDTCYVDTDVLNFALLRAGIAPEDEVMPNHPDIIRTAILIVKGWVETSRSEAGISTAIDMERVTKNIIFWCGCAGLDASEFADDIRVLENGSNLW